ncbi:MAG: glycosyltransferase [Bacteroidota bacterium]|nr:glycosyltransferase [Bacteroidota bacterium]
MFKKILYVVPAFPIGGAEKFLIMLVNSMANEANQTVVSLSTNNKLQHEFDASVSFTPIPRKHKFDLKAVRSFRKMIKHDKPDVIFCLNFFSFFFTKLAMLGLRLKSPLFISYQTTIHLNRKEEVMHKFYTSIVNKNDHILFTSRNQEVYTVNKYRIPRRSFNTIINGIDLKKWHLPDNYHSHIEIRKQYGIPDNAPVIIMTAAFRAEKNHTGAIRSLKILHEKYDCKAYLLFVGGGNLFEQVRQYSLELGMQDFTRFTGPQNDVRPFYWSSNLFTLCSTSVETFSFAALEAMACGLPLVLTDIGGANEMIVEGLNGYLSKTDDEDIALNWFKALSSNFSAGNIHGHAKQYFNADRMTNEYKEYLIHNTLN